MAIIIPGLRVAFWLRTMIVGSSRTENKNCSLPPYYIIQFFLFGQKIKNGQVMAKNGQLYYLSHFKTTFLMLFKVSFGLKSIEDI